MKSESEEKIARQLVLMKEELGKEQGVNLAHFWELRKELLLLFKENLSPSARSKLWADYLVVSEEARLVRSHQEEGAQFAAEQVELAIAALEKESLSFFENQESFIKNHITFDLSTPPKQLAPRLMQFVQLERKIQALYNFASKVIELREELIKIPLRMRVKAKYFDRLSLLGDKIFPLRKEYMAEISRNFTEEVSQFTTHHFSPSALESDKIKRSLFFFREEIKKFQAWGQQLSLQGSAFAEARKQLSHCWDLLKGLEKELKKEFSEQKALSAAQMAQVLERIAACKAKEGLTLEQLQEEVVALQQFTNSLPLVKEDMASLKEEITLLSLPLEEHAQKMKESQRAEAVAAEERRVAIYKELLAKIEAVRLQMELLEPQEVEARLHALKKEGTTLSLSKLERQELQQILQNVTEQLARIKEKRLLSLGAEDQHALALLTAALKEQQEVRKSCKAQMEIYRKKKGATNLDFEQALALEELVEQEKGRLLKIDQLIEDYKIKISTFKLC